MERLSDNRRGSRTGTAAWRRLRREVLDRDGWRCQRCGLPGALEVHHRDHDPTNNDRANLTTYCRPCHIETHRPPVSPDVAAWRRLVAEGDRDRYWGP